MSTKVNEEDLLRLLDENKTDEEIKSFFEQQEKQSTALEQIALFDGSTLSQDKLVLIIDKLIFDKVLGKQDLLVYAAKDGYLKVVEEILDVEGIDVNHLSQHGYTALMLAAKNGYLKVVEKLLDAEGIDVNKVGKDDLTALMLAANNGHLEVVEKLLRHPMIKVNESDSYDQSALMLAANNAHLEVVEKLLGVTRIDVDKVGKDGFTALMLVAYNGHSELLEKLLDVEGIDVNKVNKADFTALMLAAYNGRLEVVEKLLDVEGIDVNKVSKNGFTALMLAAYNGHLEVVDKIFKRLCIDGVNPEDIHYIEGDRPKVFKDADKISSFANQLCSLIKAEFNLSADGNHSIEILVRQSLFKEIFTDENKENIDFITNSFMQDEVADGISRKIVKNLRSSDEAIIPSSSIFCWIPFNNLKTLNIEHEGIESLFTSPIKEFINQVLAPDPGSFIYNQSGIQLESEGRVR